MRPHLAHIQNTLIKKKLAEDAKESQTSYAKYSKLVEKAKAQGIRTEFIIEELHNEKERIIHDIRKGDELFQNGLHNAKVACVSSIMTIIDELKKGEE